MNRLKSNDELSRNDRKWVNFYSFQIYPDVILKFDLVADNGESREACHEIWGQPRVMAPAHGRLLLR